MKVVLLLLTWLKDARGDLGSDGDGIFTEVNEFGARLGVLFFFLIHPKHYIIGLR